jgi:hypothetical protein
MSAPNCLTCAPDCHANSVRPRPAIVDVQAVMRAVSVAAAEAAVSAAAP